jgi:hypothetical protein
MHLICINCTIRKSKNHKIIKYIKTAGDDTGPTTYSIAQLLFENACPTGNIFASFAPSLRALRLMLLLFNYTIPQFINSAIFYACLP